MISRTVEGADESISFRKVRHEPGLLGRTEHHLSPDGCNVVESGIARKESGKLFKGSFEIAAHSACPTERRTSGRERRDVLVPKMKVDEAATDGDEGSIGQGNVVGCRTKLQSEDAMRVIAVLKYLLPGAKRSIDHRNQ
ncbi:hypothetical protein [Bradyrhizobium sp.]|uniref:hypothetical protein n=1 Tax=Bradyrhizobium sp. TaxID=376 RepID=UPI0023A66173|nr:hypothetical protein [Bradyrhizobium sp.]MDE1934738.1 hypothetical protein [Bradyrhizobium sp.]